MMESNYNQTNLNIAVEQVEKSASFIKEYLPDHVIRSDCFRYCFELYHQALFKNFPIVSPSLELGSLSGIESYLVHRDKPDFDFGTLMPSNASVESWGNTLPFHLNHYKEMIGMDYANIPFADNSFASVFSVHSLHFGQDLQSMINEIIRVLLPGGVYVCSTSLSEWYQFPSIVRWIEQGGMQFKFYSKEDYLNCIGTAGAVDIQYRTFFNSVLHSTVLVASHKIPSQIKSYILSEIGHGGEVDELYALLEDTFVTIIKRELTGGSGPEDGFYIFITFKKSGVLPVNPVMPQPICVRCRSQLSNKNLSSRLCLGCGAIYSVHGGVPMLIDPEHPTYAGSTIRQNAALLAEAADSQLTQLLPQLQNNSFYVLYDGQTPVPGLKPADILISFLRHYQIKIDGIVALVVSEKSSWKGYSVVQLGELPPRSKLLLLTAEREQIARWVNKLRDENLRVSLYGIFLAESAQADLQILEL